jgi:hypothetical protein
LAPVLGWLAFHAQPARAVFEQREIAAVSGSNNHDLFMIDTDYTIKHFVRTRGRERFGAFEQLDGLGRDVAAVERSDGMLEVFVVGMDGDVWRNQQLGRARWHGFALMGFHCKRIAVTKTASGRYELFVIGKDDLVYRSVRQGDDGPWSEWQSLQALGTELALAADGDMVRVFIVGKDRSLWTTRSDQVAWTSLDGVVQDVAVTRSAEGQLVLFATDLRGHIWQRRSLDAERNFGSWRDLAGAAARLSATDAALGAQKVFALGAKVSELESATEQWRELDDKLPLEITFYGVATMEIPSVNVTQQRAMHIGVRFSRDHRHFKVISFPSFTTAAFDTPFGKSTTTVSMSEGGSGTFDPATGRMELQVKLHFDQSLDVPFVQEDADVSLTLTTDAAKPVTQGPLFAEAGLTAQSRLMAQGGLNPLNGKACRVSIAGYFVAPATLLTTATL